MLFAVVNRAWMTSETLAIFFIVHFFCAIGLMTLYILIAVVLTSVNSLLC